MTRLTSLIEDRVVADRFQSKLPASCREGVRIRSYEAYQLRADALAQRQALRPVAEQFDRPLELLAILRLVRRQLGRGLLRLPVLSHGNSLAAMPFGTQAALFWELRARAPARDRSSPNSARSRIDEGSVDRLDPPSNSTIVRFRAEIGHFLEQKRGLFVVRRRGPLSSACGLHLIRIGVPEGGPQSVTV
jgi:hypothetical protein